MYNTDNVQYIFKQSSGRICNLYFDEKSGLCFSNLNKRNSWAEPVTIQKNIHQLFYAEMDSDDCFHLLLQNSQGNIMYSHIDNGNSRNYPVLNGKTPDCYNKHLSLVPFKNNIHFFYTLKHNNLIILAHQIFNSSNVGTPKVIDYVIDSSSPYSLACDTMGNIYVFYQSSDGKYLQMGYKKYSFSQKLWGDFSPVTKYAGDTEYPRLIIDNRNIIHLCYQRRSSKQFELVYQQKVPDKNIWSNETIIHSSVYIFESASIIEANNRLVIFWVRDDVIYYRMSENNGVNWTKASRYNFPSGRQLICMSYKTNASYEAGKITAPRIPGTFINGYKLAFYKEAQNPGSEMSPDDLRSMLIDGLKLLKGSVEELRESDSFISDNITKLSSIQQNFEREITKYSLKLNMLENEINQLKSAYAKLEPQSPVYGERETTPVSGIIASKTVLKEAGAGEKKLKSLQRPGKPEHKKVFKLRNF